MHENSKKMDINNGEVLLKILALSRKEIAEGKTRPIKKVFSDMRRKLNLPLRKR